MRCQVHTDDPLRAVLTCLELVDVLRGLGLIGRYGLTTGRVPRERAESSGSALGVSVLFRIL